MASLHLDTQVHGQVRPEGENSTCLCCMHWCSTECSGAGNDIFICEFCK